MSREVRRVPVDFAWPLDKVWDGYLMPERLRETTCRACYGRGSTPARQWIERIGLMLDQLISDLDDQDAGKPLHPWLAHDPYPPVDHNTVLHRDGMWVTYAVVRPTPDIVEFAQALITGDPDQPERQIQRGWLAQNRYAVTQGLIRQAGLPAKWGWCATCDGHGSVEVYEGQRADSEAWESTEPPTGDGWQLWETVSEGSPVTPVFPTREGLVEHLSSPAYRRPLTRDEAEGLVDAGWVPSMIATAAGVLPGEQSAGDFARVVHNYPPAD
ncbi:hypothetical protein ACFWU5_16515 [Nocardia sp. NPDC058640]|uniref:hypothetical protein n=1 Tax=Nocardia sp. NPDC058640 TaxID=3346571 RepID=UPI00365F0096